jgi:hypothetical protein
VLKARRKGGVNCSVERSVLTLGTQLTTALTLSCGSNTANVPHTGWETPLLCSPKRSNGIYSGSMSWTACALI